MIQLEVLQLSVINIVYGEKSKGLLLLEAGTLEIAPPTSQLYISVIMAHKCCLLTQEKQANLCTVTLTCLSNHYYMLTKLSDKISMNYRDRSKVNEPHRMNFFKWMTQRNKT